MENRNFTEYRMEDFLTDESFINYCFRRNADDELFWKEWFLQHPEKEPLEKEAKETLQMLSLTLPDDEYKVELERIKASIARVIPSAKPSIGRFLNWKKIASAAAVLIFCIGGYLLFQKSRSNSLTETYNRETIPLVFTLSDNTVVTLAANSSLRYPSNFGGQERKVYLNGNAGFRVTHNAAHPFKVYEDDIVATDLGTVFNIKKQQRDSVLVIELLEGKLGVETVNASGSPMQSIILAPNEKAMYSRVDKQMRKELMTSGSAPAQNHFVFHQAGFEDVARQIKDAFGVTVINQSNKGPWRFTGEFTNTTADEIIENISLIEHLKTEVRGDTILIK